MEEKGHSKTSSLMYRLKLKKDKRGEAAGGEKTAAIGGDQPESTPQAAPTRDWDGRKERLVKTFNSQARRFRLWKSGGSKKTQIPKEVQS